MLNRIVFAGNSSMMAGASQAEVDFAARHPKTDVLSLLWQWSMVQPNKPGVIAPAIIDKMDEAIYYVKNFDKRLAFSVSGGSMAKSSGAGGTPVWMAATNTIISGTTVTHPGKPEENSRQMDIPVEWEGDYQQRMGEMQRLLAETIQEHLSAAGLGLDVIHAVHLSWALHESSHEFRIPITKNGTNVDSSDWDTIWIEHGYTPALAVDLFEKTLADAQTFWPDTTRFTFPHVLEWPAKPPNAQGWPNYNNPIKTCQNLAWPALGDRFITVLNQQPRLSNPLRDAIALGWPIGGQTYDTRYGDGTNKPNASPPINAAQFGTDWRQAAGLEEREGMLVESEYWEHWAKTVGNANWMAEIPDPEPDDPTYDELLAENAELKAEVATLNGQITSLTASLADADFENERLAATIDDFRTSLTALLVFDVPQRARGAEAMNAGLDRGRRG